MMDFKETRVKSTYTCGTRKVLQTDISFQFKFEEYKKLIVSLHS